MMQAFAEAEKYIDSIPKFVKKNTMQDTKAFYGKLLCPCRRTRVIHVAGTNGKGSVCAYLQSVLMEAGYRTGMFISPHLVDIRERIRVDQELISEEDFVEAFRKVRDCLSGEEGEIFGVENRCRFCEEVQAAEAEELRSGYHPSYFEYLYFMAMLYFEKKQPDFIILETGLGGRLDATNSFETPCICIITKISLDHTEYLGETLGEIAAEKAGIVKKGIPLVYFANNKDISDVMEKSAEKAETRAFSVNSEEICLKKYDEKGIDFSYYSGYYKYSMFHLSTTALYQTENAALCVKALAVLKERGIVDIPGEILHRGLAKARWEGRMEEILPAVYVDGAHNPDGIAAFLRSVRADLAKKGRILLYSSLREKACGQMIGEIRDAELFGEIVVTKIESYRAAGTAFLAALFGGKKVTVIEDVGEAFRYCIGKKTEGMKVYITGSLYLAGQIKALMKDLHD